MRRIRSVKADNVVILVFDPDAPDEMAGARISLGGDVHHDAAHFPEKLAADKGEVVILALKILVENRHLGETERQVSAEKLA